MDRKVLGPCKDCCWRRSDGTCINPKLHEDDGDMAEDELVYSYMEMGYFWVGPNFGCVHWTNTAGA